MRRLASSSRFRQRDVATRNSIASHGKRDTQRILMGASLQRVNERYCKSRGVAARCKTLLVIRARASRGVHERARLSNTSRMTDASDGTADVECRRDRDVPPVRPSRGNTCLVQTIFHHNHSSPLSSFLTPLVTPRPLLVRLDRPSLTSRRRESRCQAIHYDVSYIASRWFRLCSVRARSAGYELK